MDDTELARLHQAVQADPADTAARLTLLHGLVMARRWHESEQVGSPLLQAEDAPATVHTCMGIVYGKQGRLDEAVQQCRQALALDPDDVLALGNLGSLLAHQDDPKAALSASTRPWTTPQIGQRHTIPGTVLLRQERYQEAIRACDRALECRATYPEAHFNRGNAHALRGLEADGSLNYYDLTAPSMPIKRHTAASWLYRALYNLGMVYQRMGSAEGVRVWDQYIEARRICRMKRSGASEPRSTRDLQDRLR
jgi:tetratricopeptide (TPR) repeat protein